MKEDSQMVRKLPPEDYPFPIADHESRPSGDTLARREAAALRARVAQTDAILDCLRAWLPTMELAGNAEQAALELRFLLDQYDRGPSPELERAFAAVRGAEPDTTPTEGREAAAQIEKLREALTWALRNRGGECPADDPKGYAKALGALTEPDTTGSSLPDLPALVRAINPHPPEQRPPDLVIAAEDLAQRLVVGEQRPRGGMQVANLHSGEQRPLPEARSDP